MLKFALSSLHNEEDEEVAEEGSKFKDADKYLQLSRLYICSQGTAVCNIAHTDKNIDNFLSSITPSSSLHCWANIFLLLPQLAEILMLKIGAEM